VVDGVPHVGGRLAVGHSEVGTLEAVHEVDHRVGTVGGAQQRAHVGTSARRQVTARVHGKSGWVSRVCVATIWCPRSSSAGTSRDPT
jgi:hypothetical protein